MMQAQIIVDRFLRSEISHKFKLTVYEKMLLVMLASYIGLKEDCYPSHLSLCIDCSMSLSSLKRSIESLACRGLIKVSRSCGTNNRYQLAIPSPIVTGLSQNQALSELPIRSIQDLPPGSVRATNNISNNISKCTSLVGSQKHRAKQSRSKLSFPEDLKINDSHKMKASQLGLDVESEFEHFKEHHLAKGNKFADWAMAFHTWLRNAVKYSKKNTITSSDNMAGVI